MPRTYMVVSTSLHRRADRLSHPVCFASGDALDGLARELAAAFEAGGRASVPLTLKVHGFNVRRGDFEREVVTDADPSSPCGRRVPRPAPRGRATTQESLRPADGFYVGFRWPSEGLLSRASLRDTLSALYFAPLIGLGLLLVPALALLARWPEGATPSGAGWMAGSLAVAGEWLNHCWPALVQLAQVLLAPYAANWGAGLLLGAGVLLIGLRLSTYARDRYRVLHYGIPDLGEFMRALEERLVRQGVKVRLDVVGHSMGSLLLVNALRVMSDYFHGPEGPTEGALGRDGTFQLGTLVLCAPDLPAVMAVPDRNNYFLSALRRFESTHVFSSDRDLILRWLSSFANWMSEPRQDMAGRRLGNVLLARDVPVGLRRPDSRSDWQLCPMTRPVLRHFQLYPEDPVLPAHRPADLHFHDCTLDPHLSGTNGTVLAVVLLLFIGLALLTTVSGAALLRWLVVMTALFPLLGAMARLLWPRVRDRRGLRALVGFFADWPTLAILLIPGRAWNFHSGYFALGGAVRQRIAAILARSCPYPPRGVGGEELEEVDGPIRYRRVRVSV